MSIDVTIYFQWVQICSCILFNLLQTILIMDVFSFAIWYLINICVLKYIVRLTSGELLCFCPPWWRHQMETFSALLVLCTGNSPVTGEFPTQRPVMRGFNVFFDLRLNKWLSKQSWGWWFETPSRPLWRYCNAEFQPWASVFFRITQRPPRYFCMYALVSRIVYLPSMNSYGFIWMQFYQICSRYQSSECV